MMMGPEPIIITFLISLRFGIGFFSFHVKEHLFCFGEAGGKIIRKKPVCQMRKIRVKLSVRNWPLLLLLLMRTIRANRAVTGNIGLFVNRRCEK
jgi:hypothetical protein